METNDVGLRVMGESDVDGVVAVAVRGATPAEVMPPDDELDPVAWTPSRRRRYGAFLRSRLLPLPDGRCESSYLVVVDAEVAGVARLVREPDQGTFETGLWLVRSARARGVGNQVLRQLITRAREAGGRELTAGTTTDNAAALASLRRHGAALSPSSDHPGAVDASLDLSVR